MTTQEKIAVMQAYADGKTIEIAESGRTTWCDYTNFGEPLWAWDRYDYRVKPEPKDTYRPYANFAEFRAEWEKHGGWAIYDNTGKYRFVNDFLSDCGANALLTYYAWADDGTPCGIKVKD